MAKKDLTYQQELFCQHYVAQDLNATKAAELSSYSKESAASQGSRLLKNDKIIKRVEELIGYKVKALQITEAKVLAELHDMAFIDVAELYDDHGNLKNVKDLPLRVRKAIASIEVVEEYETVDGNKTAVGSVKKVKLWNKEKSLEMLGKKLKIFADIHKHEGHLTLEQLVGGSMEEPDKDKDE